MSEFLSPGTFTWMLGIEDTCVYRPSGEAIVDEHELTGHSLKVEPDIALAKRLGAKALRYGVSWPSVHKGPQQFDWGPVEEGIETAAAHGLGIIADLVHYGTPTWLEGSFVDERYPQAVTEFALALLDRFGDAIGALTPINEPITTASFCGLRSVWPPALGSWAGWAQVVAAVIDGAQQTTRALRVHHPDVAIVHVEASAIFTTRDSHLEDECATLADRMWLPTDLLLGRLTDEQITWLRDNEVPQAQLTRLLEGAAPPDVIGVNYYPNLTPRMLVRVGDTVEQAAYHAGPDALAQVLRGFAERYQLPVALTETSIEGDDRARLRWLNESANAVLDLRRQGVDVRGYTWWPLFDFVDWSYGTGGESVEEFGEARLNSEGQLHIQPLPTRPHPSQGKTKYLRRMGLIRLDETPDGDLTRTDTSAANRYAALTQEVLR